MLNAFHQTAHKKVFIALSLIMACLVSAFVYLNNELARSALDEELKKQRDTYQRVFNAQINNTTDNLLLIASLFANNVRVQDLFYLGKEAVLTEGGGAGGPMADAYRERLYKLVGPEWNQAILEHQTRQLHFHIAPGSLSFLRVHKPEKFGDRMDDIRHIIVETNKTQAPHTGFETGRVYSGLRGVAPVWHTSEDGERIFVGAVEAGTSFTEVLESVAQHLKLDAAIVLKRDHLQNILWESNFQSRDNERLSSCDCIFESSSGLGVEERLRALLESFDQYDIASGYRRVELEGGQYVLYNLPVRDFLGDQNLQRPAVGSALFLENLTARISALDEDLEINILYGIFTYLAVELILLLSISRIANHLTLLVERATLSFKEAERLASVGSWLLDHRSGTLEWSDEIYRLFEIDKRRFGASYQAFLDLIHPKDKDRVNQAFTRSMETKTPYSVEHRLLFPGGRIKHVREIGSTEYDHLGNPRYSRGTVQDITQQKLAEEKLEEINAALTDAETLAHMGNFKWHFASGKVTWSAGMYALVDRQHEEEIDIDFVKTQALMPEQVERIEHWVEQGIASQLEDLPVLDTKLKHASGNEIDVLAHARVHYERGEPAYLFGTCLDISDRVKAEREIAAQARRAEDASRAKSDFLANMSHEIRTPMNGVIGMIQLLQTTQMDDEQREYARTLNASAQGLLRIINDILDYSKIEAGKVSLERSEFSLLELIEETFASMRPQAEAKGIALTYDLTALEKLPRSFYSDSTRIKQILNNLISNAIKFTHEGSVDLRLNTVEENQETLRLRISVHDTGIGIPTEQQEKLFERFTQADISTTKRYGGTGLGLSISRRLVELLEGTIGFDSEPGVGTEFWVELPLYKVESNSGSRLGLSVPKPVTSLPEELKSIRVLVAEDNLVNQKVAGGLLSKLGVNYEIAENGAIALEKLKHERFDLVFMDVQMPEMDGFETTAQIRSATNLSVPPNLPIVAMTANSMPEDRERCLAAGMDDYVAKPVSSEKIILMLTKWLS